jgi:hypothetical protein
MAHFQKDGLWIQGGGGLMENVSEDTPYVPGQVGKVLSVKTTDGKTPRFYQYVKRYTTETLAAAANAPAFWQDVDDFVVTADTGTAIGGATNPVLAGVWLGTSPAAGKYGFIQVGGLATLAVTDTVQAGDNLVPSLSTFQQFAALVTLTTEAASTPYVPPVGIALSAVGTSTDSTISAVLRPFRNGW